MKMAARLPERNADFRWSSMFQAVGIEQHVVAERATDSLGIARVKDQTSETLYAITQ